MVIDFKQQLRAAYDADAQRRVNNEINRDKWKLECRENFADRLKRSNKKTILELGCGVGTDSLYFTNRGFDVLATDLSSEMILRCKEKGIEARVLDLYEVSDLGKKYDGVFSMNVLLHVPRKDIAIVLQKIYGVLNPGGLFFYGVYGGFDKEETIVDHSKMGLPRLFSFLSDKTIQRIVKPWFEIIEFETVEIGSVRPNFHFQSLLLKRKD